MYKTILFVFIVINLFIISLSSCTKKIRKSCNSPKHLATPDPYTIIIASKASPPLGNKNLSLIKGRKAACLKALEQGDNILIREGIYRLAKIKSNTLPFPSDKKSYTNILSSAKKIKTDYLSDLSCKVYISYHSLLKFSLIQKIATKKWEKKEKGKKKSLKQK